MSGPSSWRNTPRKSTSWDHPQQGHPGQGNRLSRRHYRDVPYLLNSQDGPLRGTPLAFAHRGADLSCENTMAAFTYAVELGYRYLEIDVRTAADGTLVVFHDETLDRITDGSGRLSEKTWRELSQLRVGRSRAQPRSLSGSSSASEPDSRTGSRTGSLVRFEDLLTAWDDVHLNVDLKDNRAVERFVDIVERHQAHHRVLVASFHDARQRRVGKLLSRRVAASGGWLYTALLVLLGPVFLGPLGRAPRLIRQVMEIDCVQVPAERGPLRIVRPKFIEWCHRAGLQVHVWVVDEPEEMHRLLDMGVDGLMTDDAEALAEVMKERAIWPQRPQA